MARHPTKSRFYDAGLRAAWGPDRGLGDHRLVVTTGGVRHDGDCNRGAFDARAASASDGHAAARASSPIRVWVYARLCSASFRAAQTSCCCAKALVGLSGRLRHVRRIVRTADVIRRPARSSQSPVVLSQQGYLEEGSDFDYLSRQGNGPGGPRLFGSLRRRKKLGQTLASTRTTAKRPAVSRRSRINERENLIPRHDGHGHGCRRHLIGCAERIVGFRRTRPRELSAMPSRSASSPPHPLAPAPSAFGRRDHHRRHPRARRVVMLEFGPPAGGNANHNRRRRTHHQRRQWRRVYGA